MKSLRIHNEANFICAPFIIHPVVSSVEIDMRQANVQPSTSHDLIIFNCYCVRFTKFVVVWPGLKSSVFFVSNRATVC